MYTIYDHYYLCKFSATRCFETGEDILQSMSMSDTISECFGALVVLFFCYSFLAYFCVLASAERFMLMQHPTREMLEAPEPSPSRDSAVSRLINFRGISLFCFTRCFKPTLTCSN